MAEPAAEGAAREPAIPSSPPVALLERTEAGLRVVIADDAGTWISLEPATAIRLGCDLLKYAELVGRPGELPSTSNAQAAAPQILGRG